MISCVSPGADSADHTINTLRYSDRLKFKKEINERDTESKQSVSWKINSKSKAENSNS